MSKIPKYWNIARKYLSRRDRVMSSLIKKYKSPSETVLTTRKDIFYSLCKKGNIKFYNYMLNNFII